MQADNLDNLDQQLTSAWNKEQGGAMHYSLDNPVTMHYSLDNTVTMYYGTFFFILSEN